jgi:hypothetical protein
MASEPTVIPPPAVGEPEPLFDRPDAGPAGVPEPPGDAGDAYGASPDARRRLVEYATRAYRLAMDRREVFERVWWRNLLYASGRQWIYWDPERRRFADRRLARYIPRPVTNIVAENADSIMSVFQAVRLSVDVQPVLGDGENAATRANLLAAAVANRYEPVLRAEHDMTAVERQSDFWLVYTGNVFWHLWWDAQAEGSYHVVPLDRCQQCGRGVARVGIPRPVRTCPECGGPVLPDGHQSERVLVGRGRTDVCSPFEVAAPPMYGSLHESPFLFRLRWRPREYYAERLPRARLAKLRFGSSPTIRSLRYLLELSTLTDLTSGLSLGLSSGPPTEGEGLDEVELWARPSRLYPRGLVARFAGEPGSGELIELPDEGLPGPLPHETPQGERLVPWVQVRYSRFGRRLWSPAPIDRIIRKQDTVNQVDALSLLILSRMANPIWLLPDTTSVKQFSGAPGVVLRYKVLGPNAAEPKRLPGENIPGSIVRLREQQLADTERLLGTYDVLKGARPANVEAFSAMQLLVERSQSRFGIPLEERGLAYADWFRLALELERLYGPPTRRYAMRGPAGSYSAVQVQLADLVGQVQVLVQDGSQVPKTSLGNRAAIQQLQSMQVIDVRDPETKYQILRQFGRTDLMPTLDVDVKSALAEQEAFERWAATVQLQQADGPDGPQIVPETPPPGERQPWHNDAVHLAQHRRWANSETVQVLLAQRPEIAPFIAWLLAQHEPTPVPSGPPPGVGADGQGIGAARAMERSNAESGRPIDAAAEAPPQFAAPAAGT